jgi:hypothetical protein
MAQYSQEVVKKWPKRVAQEIIILGIMEQFGWTYDEFLQTPSYLIDIIIEKNIIDFKISKQK